MRYNRPRPLIAALLLLALIAAPVCATVAVRTTAHAADLEATVAQQAAWLEADSALLDAYAAKLDAAETRCAETSAALAAVQADNAALVAAAEKPTRKPQPKATAKAATRKGCAPLIRSIAAAEGLSAADTAALIEIARRESTLGTNPKAYAAGRRCVGLYQLDAAKGSYAQRCDDAWSTRRAIRYMRSRYGSPAKALAAHNRQGWY